MQMATPPPVCVILFGLNYPDMTFWDILAIRLDKGVLVIWSSFQEEIACRQTWGG